MKTAYKSLVILCSLFSAIDTVTRDPASASVQGTSFHSTCFADYLFPEIEALKLNLVLPCRYEKGIISRYYNTS